MSSGDMAVEEDGNGRGLCCGGWSDPSAADVGVALLEEGWPGVPGPFVDFAETDFRFAVARTRGVSGKEA